MVHFDEPAPWSVEVDDNGARIRENTCIAQDTLSHDGDSEQPEQNELEDVLFQSNAPGAVLIDRLIQGLDEQAR